MDPGELWDHLSATGSYTQWWPWLRRFEPGDGFVADERWSCEVSPPLPYRVRFDVRLDDVQTARRVASTITGDIGGTAVLTMAESPTGTSARLVSDLRPTNRVLRGYGAVARPLVEFGHNWILDQGRRQFVERITSDDRVDH